MATVPLLGLIATFLWHLDSGPYDEDDWLFFAMARWLGAHVTDAEAMRHWLLEYPLPREPIYRPVTYLWFGLEYGLFGTAWWAWRLVTAALHVATAWQVRRLGTALGWSARAASLAAVVYAVHPLASETIVWINAQETQLLVLLVVAAVVAVARCRPWQAVALGMLAMLTKEQGVVVLGLGALVVLADRTQWRPRAKAGLGLIVVAAAIGAFRWLVLTEPNNSEHLEFLSHFMSLSDIGHGVIVLAPLLTVPIVAGLGPSVWLAASLGGLLGASLGRAVAGLPRRSVFGLLAFAGAWAVLGLGPAIADIGLPRLDQAPGVSPDWNFRHLALGLVGPALVMGALFARLMDVRGGPVAVCLTLSALAATLALNTWPYAQLAERQQAAIAAVGQGLAPNAGLRLVQPNDTISTTFQYRRWVEPDAPVVPILVGEPRCGCATAGAVMDARDARTVRAMTEAFFVRHRVSGGRTPEGASCRCKRWRTDATFFRLEGPAAGPFRLVPDS